MVQHPVAKGRRTDRTPLRVVDQSPSAQMTNASQAATRTTAAPKPCAPGGSALLPVLGESSAFAAAQRPRARSKCATGTRPAARQDSESSLPPPSAHLLSTFRTLATIRDCLAANSPFHISPLRC